jgi:hypothetical protein
MEQQKVRPGRALSDALRFQITLRDPLNPPRVGKYPIDDLPSELLSYVFQLGLEIEQEEWDEDQLFKLNVNQWEDCDGARG